MSRELNLAVCLKQVPDTAEMRLDPLTNTLIREGVEAVLNPLDEFPLEAALRLRERNGGRVVAFTMGPPQARQVLMKAVAMGADEGVLVSDRAFAGADTWATSLTLARAIVTAGTFDLIFCGKQAVDGDTAQVGPGIAAHLGWPQVAYVTKVLAFADGELQVERLFDEGTGVLAVQTPAVITVLKDANEPRLPCLAGRVRAQSVPPRTLDAAALGLPASELGLKGSPTRVVKIAVPKTQRQQVRLSGAPNACAQALTAQLQQRHLLHQPR